MDKVVIVIPTYNEAENISLLLDQLLILSRAIRKFSIRILIVDDNSPDHTGDIVHRYMSKYKNIEMLSGEKKGLGKAMVRGYTYAIGKLKADIVVTNEADFGFDFKHLPLMLDKISEGYDVVVASRHVDGGSTSGWTITRRLNHWVANSLFATLVAGVNQVKDHNGAFRAIRVKGVLDKINFDKLEVTGFGFFFFLIYRLTRITDKIYEFPTKFTFRTRGESKVSFNKKYLFTYLRDIVEYIFLSFKIRLLRCRIK
ncbi:glycosyltransferase [Candidatus Woesebacteria bacterium]|nr:MAG: glycosyltransferase [Candidatus Woesebacteria bacterium]